MSENRVAKDEWVTRVLGLSLGLTLQGAQGASGATDAVKTADGTAVRAALDQFDAAQEAVDAQIAQLQARLRGTDDPDLHRIAEFGLNAITGNTRVKVQAALLAVRRTLPHVDAKAAGEASRHITQMAAHLASDGKVAACDRNPFGVPVSIARTLGGALQQLDSALRAAA